MDVQIVGERLYIHCIKIATGLECLDSTSSLVLALVVRLRGLIGWDTV